jgi:hypothetical protein
MAQPLPPCKAYRQPFMVASMIRRSIIPFIHSFNSFGYPFRAAYFMRDQVRPCALQTGRRCFDSLIGAALKNSEMGRPALRPFYSFGMTISLVPNSFRIIFAFQIAPNRHKLRVMAGT